MREASLGHWNYFTWHLPALVLAIAGIALVIGMARSLRRNALRHVEAGLYWRVIGWTSLAVAMLSAVVWPYLTAFATVSVDQDGTWCLRNYLGVPLAHVPAGELREIRGVDLGGLGMGIGYLEVRRADGESFRSVRIDRPTLDAARRSLGYPRAMVHDSCGDQVIAAHAYDSAGPHLRVVP